jgi:hypothetical protein
MSVVRALREPCLRQTACVCDPCALPGGAVVGASTARTPPSVQYKRGLGGVCRVSLSVYKEMKSFYEKEPFRSQPAYAEDAPLRWEIQWLTFIPVTVASVLSTVTLVMVAVLLARTPGTSDTCDIYYDTENSITHIELRELSSFSTGLFGTPKGTDCACPYSNSQPVYVAPIDLCNATIFPRIGSDTPPLCLNDANVQKLRDHVLVCVDRAAIDRLWENGFCQAPVGPHLNKGKLVCQTDTTFTVAEMYKFIYNTATLTAAINAAEAAVRASHPRFTFPSGMIHHAAKEGAETAGRNYIWPMTHGPPYQTLFSKTKINAQIMLGARDHAEGKATNYAGSPGNDNTRPPVPV